MKEPRSQDAAVDFVLLTPEGDGGEMIFMVNGVEVGRCDHDTAGWQGMQDQQDMFVKTARALKQRVLLVDMGQHVGVIE